MTAPVAPEQQVPQPGLPGQPPAMLPPPVMPWTPFTPSPTDDEPLIAAKRRRRLSKLLDSAKFEGMPAEWKQVAILEYQRMRQVESQAAMAAVQAAQPPQKQPAQPGQKPAQPAQPKAPASPGAPQ